MAVKVDTAIVARSPVEILLIDLVGRYVDFRDPVDGVGRAPLLCDEGAIPNSKELAASVEAVLGEVGKEG